MLSEVQIEALANEVRDGQVYWQDTGGLMHRIESVSADPVDIEDDGMPVPVAYLEKGYIDLENTEPRSLFAARQLFQD